MKRTPSNLYTWCCSQRRYYAPSHKDYRWYTSSKQKLLNNTTSSSSSSSSSSTLLQLHSYYSTSTSGAWGTTFAAAAADINDSSTTCSDTTTTTTSSRSCTSSTIVQQVHDILLKSHVPRVAVQPSQIVGAGNGVFYVNPDDNESTSCSDEEHEHQQHQDQSPQDQHQPTVLCLYPGIYTPGLPSHIVDGETSSMYLASNEEEDETGALTPSGISFQDNAYILNVPVPYNGYIDGNDTTTTVMNSTSSSSIGEGARLLLSKFCGHHINHAPSPNKPRTSSDSSRKSSSSPAANVRVVGFQWNDVRQVIRGNLLQLQQQQELDRRRCHHDSYGQHHQEDYDDDTTTTATSFEDFTIQQYYHRIPNSIRNDGTPWYYDPYQQEIIFFPTSTSSSFAAWNDNNSTTTATSTSHGEQTNNNGINNCNSSSSTLSNNDDSFIPLVGAAIVADRPSSNIGHGEELYLDYGLREPYPRWASSWYEQ